MSRSQDGAKGCNLFVTGIFDALFLRLKLAIITGVIITSPFWLYQLWAFIAPGLYKRERRWAYFFGGAAVPLFALGGTLAYFAMTKGLRFLLDLVPARRGAADHDQHLPRLRHRDADDLRHRVRAAAGLRAAEPGPRAARTSGSPSGAG